MIILCEMSKVALVASGATTEFLDLGSWESLDLDPYCRWCTRGCGETHLIMATNMSMKRTIAPEFHCWKQERVRMEDMLFTGL